MNAEHKKIIDCVVGACSLEGRTPSKEAIQLCENLLERTITVDEAVSDFLRNQSSEIVL